MKKINFDNRNFWNSRYTTNMKLGSGTGSRGVNLKMKEDLVKQIILHDEINSVLDIGCGDCEVNKNIDIPNYTGFDVSDVIVKMNSKKFKDRKFVNGGFNQIIENNVSADLVICFDVLIHQPTLEDYQLGIKAIKNSFNKVALVSGFEKEKTRGIIYFYEDILKSFSDCKVEILEKFDIQMLIKITK